MLPVSVCVPDLLITEREGVGLATVMARKGVSPHDLNAALRTKATNSPGVVAGGGLQLLGYGPGVWLAIVDHATPAWSDELAANLRGIASVADQSSAYKVIRLSGPDARSLLQRGAFIDLGPEVFQAGAAAVTVIAHMGVVLWRSDASEIFDVACFRSHERSFRSWVEATANSV